MEIVTEEVKGRGRPQSVQKPVVAQESKMVKVENLTFSFLRQPSTGITVQGKSFAEMKEDGWLQNQIGAGLLKKV